MHYCGLPIISPFPRQHNTSIMMDKGPARQVDMLQVVTSLHTLCFLFPPNHVQCTNFELGTHVPLLISAPSQKQRNTKSSAMVELVDLFPTLTELAGLPQAPDMEGFSLVPILDDPTQTVKDAAMSQFAREGVCGKKRTPLEESPMGYTIRTAEFRYTEWVKFNYSLADPKPIWSENHGTELYLHTGDAESSMDDFENENLAEDTKYADTVKSLHEKLVTMVENKQ